MRKRTEHHVGETPGVCVVKQTVFYLKLDIVQSGTPLLCYKLYFYCRVINMGFTDY